MNTMEPPPRPNSSHSSTSLFEVYLRLRPSAGQPSSPTSLYPPLSPPAERFLTVEPEELSGEGDSDATGNWQTLAPPRHITLQPPSDRKRAIERFAFTQVFEEQTSQLDMFAGTGAVPLVEGVLAEARDGLIATLGVTGSGKTHTMLGNKSQRGMTQLSLDLLYRSIEGKTLHPNYNPSIIPSLIAEDASEAHIMSAASFLDGVYGDSFMSSRSGTPMAVGNQQSSSATSNSGIKGQWKLLGLRSDSEASDKSELANQGSTPHKSNNVSKAGRVTLKGPLPSQLPFWNSPRITRTKAKLRFGNILQDSSIMPTMTPSRPRHYPPRPTTVPRVPDIDNISVASTDGAEYAILVTMYEVYNDRIFDLLTQATIQTNGTKDLKRRPLLFKYTEGSADRKVVAGLKKIICGTYDEALMVLETGLTERRVAGTGSNSVSSRSHGFFCLEVKKRAKGNRNCSWQSSTLTIVDLAGSERARNAKTAGATLAEAGKINESLMYLGQCLQLQSDYGDSSKPTLVPFRQCKLTELLFSNSFPSQTHQPHGHHPATPVRNPQKAVMIVTADPLGDFNATSQILRYSALAREVTVPRIPSVTQMVFKDGVLPMSASRCGGRSTPDQQHVEQLETEVGELRDQLEIMAVRLAEETARRREAEENWQRAEMRAEGVEAEVREECWAEMEGKMELERRRWLAALGEEADRNDEHLDKKLEILARGIQIHEDSTATPGVSGEDMAALETENANLRAQVTKLEREVLNRSPTKATRTRSRSTAASPAKKAPIDEEDEPAWQEPPRLRPLGTRASNDPFANDSVICIDDENTKKAGGRKSSPRKAKAAAVAAIAEDSVLCLGEEDDDDTKENSGNWELYARGKGSADQLHRLIGGLKISDASAALSSSDDSDMTPHAFALPPSSTSSSPSKQKRQSSRIQAAAAAGGSPVRKSPKKLSQGRKMRTLTPKRPLGLGVGAGIGDLGELEVGGLMGTP